MQDDGGASADSNPLMIPSGRGRRSLPLSFSIVRELTRDDLGALQAGGTGAGQSAVKSLKYVHHKLARALAAGMTPGDAALRTGYTPSRVSVLQQDPAFIELISHYEEELREIYVDVHENMAALGISTIQELQERFCENPDSFSNKELMNLAELMVDRSIPTAKGGPKVIPQAGGVTLNVQFIETAEVVAETVAESTTQSPIIELSAEPAASGGGGDE